MNERSSPGYGFQTCYFVTRTAQSVADPIAVSSVPRKLTKKRREKGVEGGQRSSFRAGDSCIQKYNYSANHPSAANPSRRDISLRMRRSRDSSSESPSRGEKKHKEGCHFRMVEALLSTLPRTLVAERLPLPRVAAFSISVLPLRSRGARQDVR